MAVPYIVCDYNAFLRNYLLQENQGSTGEGNSRYDTRFSLPMDLRELEALNPVQYLVRFCKLSSTWKAFYSKTFCQNDKDKDGYAAVFIGARETGCHKITQQIISKYSRCAH